MFSATAKAATVLKRQYIIHVKLSQEGTEEKTYMIFMESFGSFRFFKTNSKF
jgi:hypothetical protein